MKPKAWRWIPAAVAVCLVAAVCVVALFRQQGVRIVSDGEEAAIAEALLGEKLSGPRYFNRAPGVSGETDGPWISVGDAIAQVPRICAERGFGPDGSRKLGLLIGRMAEPHPYRAVGGERIDLPRLNLSLDSIGEQGGH